MPQHATFLGTKLTLANRAEILAAVDAASTANPVRLATPNPEFMLLARKHPRFKQALEQMTHHIVDGFGLSVMLKLLSVRTRTPVVSSKYTGSDFIEDLFSRYADGSKSFALAGGDEGAAQKKAEQLRTKYPNISIVFAARGGTIDEANPLGSNLYQEIVSTNPDILLVGFGAPKQELWIAAARESTIPVMAGIGGSFNFDVTKKRAPRILRKLQLEWVWRAATEKGHAARAWRATVVFGILSLVSLAKRGS